MDEQKFNFERFIKAQKDEYAIALSEIKQGRKSSHWMWYIFPQLDGLGRSTQARYYSIFGLDEAVAYQHHPILGARLKEISTALLELETDDSVKVLGKIDALKLKSSMTLFNYAAPHEDIYQKVLDKFYAGEKDTATLNLLCHFSEK
ncbi:MAG: DUF1810 domain-containing protein [Pseudolactococcus laudensis]|uniref:DUF1810 domain-containing protein n=1 Tax=Pseudolactococcus laudensis TaxID=1494461 RepID=UPI003F945E01|nr:DUF1810 domain-containing protein [Lactococcus sp.]